MAQFLIAELVGAGIDVRRAALTHRQLLVGEGETLQPLPGATTNVLVFETVTPAHAGRYVCVATDAIGETRSPEITLQVKAQMPLSGATLCAFLLILAAILLIPSKRARAGA